MICEVGKVVITKKKHPCGNDEWVVVRNGADYKLKCLKCNHIVLVSSEKFKKSIKRIKEDE